MPNLTEKEVVQSLEQYLRTLGSDMEQYPRTKTTWDFQAGKSRVEITDTAVAVIRALSETIDVNNQFWTKHFVEAKHFERLRTGETIIISAQLV